MSLTTGFFPTPTQLQTAIINQPTPAGEPSNESALAMLNVICKIGTVKKTVQARVGDQLDDQGYVTMLSAFNKAIKEVQNLNSDKVITINAKNKMIAAINLAIAGLDKAAKDNNLVESEASALLDLAYWLGIFLVVFIGYNAWKNPKMVENLSNILVSIYNIVFVILIGSALITTAIWLIYELDANDWDVGKALGSLIADILKETLDLIGDLLSGLFGAVEAGSATDSGSPEWYDFISPIFAIGYIKGLVDGDIKFPTADTTVWSLGQMKDYLIKLLQKRGVPIPDCKAAVDQTAQKITSTVNTKYNLDLTKYRL